MKEHTRGKLRNNRENQEIPGNLGISGKIKKCLGKFRRLSENKKSQGKKRQAKGNFELCQWNFRKLR
jgi:hypothetical protein